MLWHVADGDHISGATYCNRKVSFQARIVETWEDQSGVSWLQLRQRHQTVTT